MGSHNDIPSLRIPPVQCQPIRFAAHLTHKIKTINNTAPPTNPHSREYSPPPPNTPSHQSHQQTRRRSRKSTSPTPPSPQKETHKLQPSLSTPINRHLRPWNHLHPSSNPLPRHNHQILATKTHIPDADGSARRDGDESAEWVFAQTIAVDGLVWRYEDF